VRSEVFTAVRVVMILNPEDGESMFLRNVGFCGQVYTVPQPRTSTANCMISGTNTEVQEHVFGTRIEHRMHEFGNRSCVINREGGERWAFRSRNRPLK
jgi:hypothetical protein